MSLKKRLANYVSEAFVAAGYEPTYGEIVPSNRRDLGQFQCNGALAAAKHYDQNSRQIAQAVADHLSSVDMFGSVTVAGPGFINLTVADHLLVEYLTTVAIDERLGCERAQYPLKVVIDYGGANIAKPMHVGHLRAAIIGEGIKRLVRFMGHDILGDIHLGDWGLPMGMVIAELRRRHPEWIYFDETYSGPYSGESPVTIDDLEEIYPMANRLAQENEASLEAARRATVELQNGRAGYLALWKQFVAVSIEELRRDYSDLNVEFDLWLGESDMQPRIAPLVSQLLAQGYAYESRGAIVVDVSLPQDKHEIPPLILVKSDGAILYGTTDLATVQQRVEEYGTELMLYVVDKRQSTHFEQVFRAAHKTGVAPLTTIFHHVGFGTMNGKDGKPFKTRAGGVLKLRTLIQMVTDKAKEKLQDAALDKEYTDKEKDEIAQIVGVAALKFADLINHYAIDYVFDLDRFLLLEGRTGPYLLYTITRAKSILRKATEKGIVPGLFVVPASDVERDLMLKIAELPDVLTNTLENYALNQVCEYAYVLSTLYNQFYHQHHILGAPERVQQESWLYLSALYVRTLTVVLDILGISIPPRM